VTSVLVKARRESFDAQETKMNLSRSTLIGVLTLAMLPAWGESTGPTDAQIAAIVVTANQVDIDAGKLASSKAHAQEVRQFGERMATDHAAVNQSATELASKLRLKPEPNEIANGRTHR
jgi:putative membrane protein